MRKTYSKPEIAFASFSMSTNIAGDCEVIINNSSRGSCTIVGTGNIPLFDSEATNICVFTNGPDQYDGACYHNPDGYKNLFNS